MSFLDEVSAKVAELRRMDMAAKDAVLREFFVGPALPVGIGLGPAQTWCVELAGGERCWFNGDNEFVQWSYEPPCDPLREVAMKVTWLPDDGPTMLSAFPTT